jgi:hypothetical protein
MLGRQSSADFDYAGLTPFSVSGTDAEAISGGLVSAGFAVAGLASELFGLVKMSNV